MTNNKADCFSPFQLHCQSLVSLQTDRKTHEHIIENMHLLKEMPSTGKVRMPGQRCDCWKWPATYLTGFCTV